jgi:periplasmic protein TonB
VRRSFGNALGLSLATHAAIFVLVLVVTSRMPDPSQHLPASAIPRSIVWMPSPGPGGGGGGGGDRTPQPPRPAQLRGSDAVTVPPPPPAVNLVKPDVSRSEQRIDIPAAPSAAGLTAIPGVIAVTPTSGIGMGPGHGPGAGQGPGAGSGPGDGGGLGPGRDRGTGGGDYRPGVNGVSFPQLLREIPPRYTPAALRAHVEGLVELRAVVLADGSVGDVWIARPLDRAFGLDEEAIRTVREWRFKPAMLNGKPVPVTVPIELRFTIR